MAIDAAKAYAAIVALVIGVALLFEGTYPTVEGWLDGVYIAIGAVLFLGYFLLVGDYLERKLRAPGAITIVPPLFVLGAVMLYYAVTKAGLTTPVKLSFVIPGVVLVAVSLFMFYREIRR